ncbi:nuclear transport factor 2 family protein [Streptomyces drozdowiczii]|uniref:Nuclear transport factor 2 family protein n=1 Tax=Streptomyces drozdowiczii TaxID=202862 RepID=A0ABY6PM85_9ACTN|nr:nuclear transport factor 2 family protein [Streptomyces drozdowiczii]MCX0247530.1 nuclear transport factor 2 family protein [Streptomyces drozdowiczii]UZK53084.1 nuclear transport factor 2 family protein [Streptomyces drozdowiczii]
MTTALQDRYDISALMTGWIHRDLGEWDRLRDLFHPDARIEITWFEGLATDFVDASAQMGTSDFRTKHLITAPSITFSSDARRAVAETNAVIIGENVRLGLGCNGHNRFIDRLERRDGEWRIADRKSVYDFATFTFPLGIVDIDQQAVARHPREYAALAYLLDASGFPVGRTFATKNSELEKEIKQSALDWLHDQRRD